MKGFMSIILKYRYSRRECEFEGGPFINLPDVGLLPGEALGEICQFVEE